MTVPCITSLRIIIECDTLLPAYAIQSREDGIDSTGTEFGFVILPLWNTCSGSIRVELKGVPACREGIGRICGLVLLDSALETSMANVTPVLKLISRAI